MACERNSFRKFSWPQSFPEFNTAHEHGRGLLTAPTGRNLKLITTCPSSHLLKRGLKQMTPRRSENSPAPPGYRITHVHRDNPDQTRGGGVAVIHRDMIDVQPRTHKLTRSSFDLQLVNVGLPSRDIVLTNIYRPSSSSKSTFLEEFGSLLAALGIDTVDRLIICGDLNLPGTSPDKIDDDLAKLLDSTSFTQLVNSPTRHNSQHIRSSLIDPIITPIALKTCFLNFSR